MAGFFCPGWDAVNLQFDLAKKLKGKGAFRHSLKFKVIS